MTRRRTHEILVDVAPDRLYRAILDIARWPAWDAGLASTEHDGTAVRPGTRFALTPKGGRRVALTVESAMPPGPSTPGLFTDVARLPLARMRNRHEFIAAGAGTRVRHTIETSGPLAALWDRVIARSIIAGLDEQTRSLAAFARPL